MLRLTLVRSLTTSWRVFLAGSLAGLAVVVLATVDPLRFFEIAELKALDAQFTVRGPRTPAAPIVVVTIDEDDFDEPQPGFEPRGSARVFGDDILMFLYIFPGRPSHAGCEMG